MEGGMAAGVPVIEVKRVRQNYQANLVAGIVAFLLEAAWYSNFYTMWVNGIGRTDEWLKQYSPNKAIQFGTALIMATLMATAISYFVQLTGPQTIWRGIKVGALLWAGFVLTAWSTEYIFEARPFSLWFVNTGYWLLGMILMGAIVGGWKKKAVASS
jgi:hypothetical protein